MPEISGDSDASGINASTEITIVNLNELTSIIYARVETERDLIVVIDLIDLLRTRN